MISEFDVEELIRGIFDLDDEIDVCDYLGEKYEDEVSWECFVKIVNDLIPFIVVGKSSLTKKAYRGFGKNGMFFLKQEIK